MTHFNSSIDDFVNADHDMNNIIRINNTSDDNDDSEDYDFDYDPNEMYFALNKKD